MNLIVNMLLLQQSFIIFFELHNFLHLHLIITVRLEWSHPMSLHLFFKHYMIDLYYFCFIAMDDVELPSDDESTNGQSKKKV